MSILDWINVGKVSAERDDNLSNYFFDNGVLHSIIKSPSSFLILGRKGAGKTALFRYFSNNRNQFIRQKDILISLSFEDYNWNIHSLLFDENKAQSLSYKQSWRFVILVETIKALRQWFESRGPVPRGLSRAAKLLEKLFNSPVPKVHEVVGRKLLTLARLKLPRGGINFEDGSLDSFDLDGGEISFADVKKQAGLRARLAENVSNIIHYLEDALKDFDSNWPIVYVCFDRVDEGWDEGSYESSRLVISGLVSASDSINTEYKGRIRPLVFLREDIFDSLSLNDANKLREDCGKLLHWDRKSLMSLVLKRINYYAKAHRRPEFTDLEALFDKTEMRQRAKPTNYILRRTMMRPRDIIAFLSRTIDTMREKANAPFNDEAVKYEKIECESIYGAEPGYSEWLRKEISDEWKVQKPEIAVLLNAIQNNGFTNFTQDMLARELEKLVGHVSDTDVLAHLRFLFDNSIIGFKLGASTEWRFKCFYPSQGLIDSSEYRVHEGLVRALNLTEARERST